MIRILVFPALLLFSAAAIAETVPPAMNTDYSNLESSDFNPGFPLVRNGNSADNTMGGTIFGDVFNGAQGNDVLAGYDGVDTYSFYPGDGADVIVDLSPEGNIIKFRAISESSVRISEVPGLNGETDRLISYGETDAIRIVGWSRMSDETKSAWAIEYLLLPTQDPVPESAGTTSGPMTSPTLFLLVMLFMAVGIIYFVRGVLKRIGSN